MKLRSGLQKPIGMLVLVVFALLSPGVSQTPLPSERKFSGSKSTIEQFLKKLQSSMSGRLPVLEGFVAAGDQSLDHYQRPYFQTSVQVSATESGNSVVRASTKITAWYVDPAGVHSGYRVLTSNGRLESDLLDQLSDELATKAEATTARTPATPPEVTEHPAEPPKAAKVEEPVAGNGDFSAPLSPTLPSREEVTEPKESDRDLQTEIKSLEEVLHNQAHPNNLVAVKQSGTAVVAAPSLTAKTLFLASAHDEFEMLDFNADWVHVRVSGLSRGWIWRNGLEMPNGVPDTATRLGAGPKATAEQLFHVIREETAPFPGDWQPLKGKSVKILSIEKVNDAAKDAGLIMRLEFAKSQLDRNYNELAQKSDTLAGIVLIFDSADGGMIAATLTAMQKWRAGLLSDSAFWHQCFFDPPELGGDSSASATE